MDRVWIHLIYLTAYATKRKKMKNYSNFIFFPTFTRTARSINSNASIMNQIWLSFISVEFSFFVRPFQLLNTMHSFAFSFGFAQNVSFGFFFSSVECENDDDVGP